MPRLRQERKREARRQSKRVFTIPAALLESQLQVGRYFGLRRKERKVSHPLKNARRRWNNGHPPQAPVRQPQPLLLRRPIKWKRERGRLPLPLLSRFLPLLARGNHANRKRRQETPRIVQHDASSH